MDIRPIRRADLPHVLNMIQGLSAFHGDTAQVSFDQLERDTMGAHPWVRVLVACDEDVLIGYAALVPKSKFQAGIRAMDVHHLFVIEDARGKGVGRALLGSCGELAKSLGCANLTIGTHPDNTHAQSVYEAYGFARKERNNPHFVLMLESSRPHG